MIKHYKLKKKFFFVIYKNGINKLKYVIKEVRELFNELRSNFSREEKKRIRYNLYEKEAIYNFLKEKDGLTDKEKLC